MRILSIAVALDAVKKALLNAKSVAYIDPDRGTIGVNAWATVQRLGIVEELRTKTVHGTGGPNAQELAVKGWRQFPNHGTTDRATCDLFLYLAVTVFDSGSSAMPRTARSVRSPAALPYLTSAS